MPRQITLSLLAIALVIVTLPIGAQNASGAPVRGNAQSWVWNRTDLPVAQGKASRTWMWGPEALTGQLAEEYDDAPGQSRVVQYFDKSRMEVTDPGGDASSSWYVTNGLLALELITGRMQFGDSRFEQRSPANINVAGDSSDPAGPTYQTFAQLLDHDPFDEAHVITERVDRSANVSNDPSLGAHGVTAAHFVPETNHTVASVFWDFINSEGIIESGSVDGPDVDRLFENPFYATGLPVTEAYWTNVQVAGEARQVLVQAFERRVLTYTPGNPLGWEVEAGNVGRHYYHWRYGDLILPGTEFQEYYTEFQDWPTGTLNAASAYQHPDGYRFSIVPDRPAGLVAIVPGETFRDVQFNLGVQRTGNSLDSAACLITRFDSVSGDAYRLCIDGRRQTFADIGRFVADGFEVRETVFQPDVRHGTLPSDQENKLLVFTHGLDTWFAINGHLIGSVRHSDSPIDGQAGIKAMNFGDTTAEWQFNYLQTRDIVP